MTDPEKEANDYLTAFKIASGVPFVYERERRHLLSADTTQWQWVFIRPGKNVNRRRVNWLKRQKKHRITGELYNWN